MIDFKLDSGFVWLSTGSCEQGSDAADFIKGGEFLDLLVERIFDFQKKVLWS
jgi:hypothetical protein